MPRGLAVVDGLSRCLCPFLEQTWSNTRPSLFRHTGLGKSRALTRAYSTGPAAPISNGDSKVATSGDSILANFRPQPRRGPRVPNWQQWETGNYSFKDVSMFHLEYRLRKEFSLKPDLRRTSQLLAVLIRGLGVKPQLIHYRAMILANRDERRGSPVQVRNLLEDMKENKVPVDSATLHAALQVLAIHPDYILRNEILRTLRDRWSPLSRTGWHDVVAGQIRERQYEMALDTLSRMEAQNIGIDPWLYDLLTYNLIDAEEFDEACCLTRKRVLEGSEISPSLWFKFLDTASEALHEESVQYIWKQRVEPGFLIPSHGMCYNALTITSRSGNTDLANSVFRILEQREAIFALSDYEALIETYLAAGDFDSVFRVLSIMAKTGIQFDPATTRSISARLKIINASPTAMWTMLKRLKAEERLDIPVIAANVLIQLCKGRELVDEAMEIYKEIHTVCAGGPNTLTFNNLFKLLRKTKTYNIAYSLVEEMSRMKVLPDNVTYETLIRLCLDTELYEKAHKYLLEMMEQGFELTLVGKIDVRTRCYNSKEPYAKLLQYHPGVRSGVRFYESGARETTAEMDAMKEKHTE